MYIMYIKIIMAYKEYILYVTKKHRVFLYGKLE